MKVFKRIIVNIKYILVVATKWTSGLFAIVGFLGLWVPLNEIFDEETKFIEKILFSTLFAFLVFFVMFIISCFFVIKRTKYKVLHIGNGHGVYVQYGDILSEKEVFEPQKRRNIVIPVNRCFDTIVDDDLISSNSLHGHVFNDLYQRNVFEPKALDACICQNLSKRHYVGECVKKSEKPAGNLKRYPVGTIAEVKDIDNRVYFLLGLTEMDSNLHVRVASDEYVQAFTKLLKFCSERSQGFPVLIPLIGTGFSNMSKKSERDVLEYMIKAIKLNSELVNCDIHIVVRNSARETVAISSL